MQKIHRFFRSLFSPLLDFRVRLFNILALGGTVISLIMTFSQSRNRFLGKCTDQHCASHGSGGLFLYSYYSGKYQQCYLITIIMIFLLVFSSDVSFTSGGYHGGMPAFFVFAIIFTGLMLETKRALIVSLLRRLSYIWDCVWSHTIFRTL